MFTDYTQIYVKKNFTCLLKNMCLNERYVRLLLLYFCKVSWILLGQLTAILTAIAFHQMRFWHVKHNYLLIPQRNYSLFKVKFKKFIRNMCKSSQIYLAKMCQQRDLMSSVTRNTDDAFLLLLLLLYTWT